jgi:hypothetical protein
MVLMSCREENDEDREAQAERVAENGEKGRIAANNS